MEKCKFCEAELEEGSTLCPGCGKDNAALEDTLTAAEETAAVEEAAAEEVVAEEPAAEEAPASEEAAAEESGDEEAAPSEETAGEESAAEESRKATPGKIALMVTAIVVVLALIVAMLAGGMPGKQPQETLPAETTEPVATIPADGNPDDETCKGSYTAEDEAVLAAKNTIVATVGDHSLTNGQLQVLYWMQVQDFLSSEYGSYMIYYGALDYTKPLDTQLCVLEGRGTWQQFFLREALATWHGYCTLSDQAKANGMELPADQQAFLDNIAGNLEASAKQYGLSSAAELLKYNVGVGADLEDYIGFQELLTWGNLYYDAECQKLTTTPEELDAYFAEHESQYAEGGVTREGKYVNVRHVLFTPEGGTTDETGATTYSEEEWAACQARAEEALNAWSAGEASEESFAQMANELSTDPGSNTNGGLYENVYEGQMVPEFNDWCFDETRVTGDSGMVKTSYGYHLMYFVSARNIWEHYAQQDLLKEKSNQLVDNLKEEFPMVVQYSDILLGYVSLAG